MIFVDETLIQIDGKDYYCCYGLHMMNLTWICVW